MPPGRGRLEVRASVPEDYHSYLTKEAAYRKVSLPTLVLSAIDYYLHPEQQERSALRDELAAVSKQLNALTPQLDGIRRMTERLDTFHQDIGQMAPALRSLVQHQQELIEQHRRLARRLYIGFSIVLGMIVLLCALVVHPWA